MCIQMLLGPSFAFSGLDIYQTREYQMKVDEATYFLYAIPAILVFIAGLHITAGKLKGEVLDIPSISAYVNKAGKLPYFFIGIGFISSLLATLFSSELVFVFTVLANFKYIGAFMLFMGTRQLKVGVLVLVFGSIILSSLGEAMFHDLITWMIMLGAVLAIKYRPGIKIKAAVTFGFFLMAVIIQQMKGEYRKSAWGKSGESGLSTFTNIYEKKQKDNSIFSFESLAKSNVRINQGYIVTNIMNNIPAKRPFEDGDELLKILEAAILPRVIAPNKLNAGDRLFFMKYSGLPLAPGTSMALSSLGDGYINFGTIGGSIFMFFLGLLFSSVLNAFNKYSKYYPVLLLFTPLVFYYPIRPDCELQTSLGHLIKSCFIIYVIIQIWRHYFIRVKDNKLEAVGSG